LRSPLAVACGNHLVEGSSELKATLVVHSGSEHIRMGEPVFGSLILPRDSKLATGTLRRAGCTSFRFKIEPATGWHDPWQHWYYSGVAKHGGGEDGPSVPCGVPAGRLGRGPAPSPQIDFTLNEWIQFDQPGTYTISMTYRARTPVQAQPGDLPGMGNAHHRSHRSDRVPGGGRRFGTRGHGPYFPAKPLPR